jgi:hypothetical protein
MATMSCIRVGVRSDGGVALAQEYWARTNKLVSEDEIPGSEVKSLLAWLIRRSGEDVSGQEPCDAFVGVWHNIIMYRMVTAKTLSPDLVYNALKGLINLKRFVPPPERAIADWLSVGRNETGEEGHGKQLVPSSVFEGVPG